MEYLEKKDLLDNSKEIHLSPTILNQSSVQD
jgi:hypothetical protein